MRAILVALCLIAVLSAAPGAEASCHFCLENTKDSCSSLDTGGCQDNVTYMGEHMPGHIIETIDGTSCSATDC